MIEKNPEKMKKIKKNIKFIILVIILSLIAWFGVKMLVSKSSTVNATATKKSNSLIQTSFGGGTPPADTGARPSGTTSGAGGSAGR